jgi:CRISPR type IV-associated protein Csf1
MPSIETSSQIYRRAAGIKRVGSVSGIADFCVLCTAAVAQGDLRTAISDDNLGESFNNKLDLHEKGNCICGDCKALWRKEFLQNYSKSYASEKGVFKLASNEDIQAFLLTPPSTPFVAIFNTRQQQHMIWRTPVCLSQDYLIVRVDDDILRINRSLALEGAKAWQLAIELMKEMAMRGQPAKIDRGLGMQSMGLLRADVVKALALYAKEHPDHKGKACAEALATLQSLRMGEWWALCALRSLKFEEPATWPQPVIIAVSLDVAESTVADDEFVEA